MKLENFCKYHKPEKNLGIERESLVIQLPSSSPAMLLFIGLGVICFGFIEA